MKFLIDAQLPVRLSYLLKSMGHDAIHTKELALKKPHQTRKLIHSQFANRELSLPKTRIFGTLFTLAKSLTSFC
jgi:predicted nuclease of predicted toxin-antitoxin system